MSLDVSLNIEKCKCCERPAERVYSDNITHNLNKMAMKADIYKELWRPDELEIENAKELIQPLTEGLKKLIAKPSEYKKLNPENGWGSYEGLVEFVEEYLQACKQYPNAEIEISR